MPQRLKISFYTAANGKTICRRLASLHGGKAAGFLIPAGLLTFAASRALYPERPQRAKAAPHPALFSSPALAAFTRQAGKPTRFTGLAG